MPFADLDDVRLEWELTGDGPPLVYLHGLSGNLELDRRLAERLGRHFTVLWYSARGHGRSTSPATDAGWDYGCFAADLDAMIDVVGFDRPYLVGGSHGANTVLRHAVEFPGRAACAAIIAPGGNALARPRRTTMTALRLYNWWAMRKGEDGFVRLITGLEPGAGDADPVTVAAARTHDLDRIGRTLFHVPDQQAVDPARLASCDLPTMVAAWEDDPIIHPIAVAREVARLMPAAQFEQIERMTDRPAADIAEDAARDLTRWHERLTTA